MRLKYISKSSKQGCRLENEDELKVDRGINYLFAAVYDGHGGYNVSTYLKKVLHKTFKNIFTSIKKSNINKSITKAYSLHQKQLAQMNMTGTGSTACVVVINLETNRLKIINLGDSRAVLCRNNFGIPLSLDHKPNWPDEKKRITELGGKIIFGRGKRPDIRIDGYSVSRSFGDTSSKYVSAVPAIYDYFLDARYDKFIIIACDGLWDVIESQEAVNFVLDLMESKVPLKDIADNLSDYAINYLKSKDNVSIVIIFMTT